MTAISKRLITPVAVGTRQEVWTRYPATDTDNLDATANLSDPDGTDSGNANRTHKVGIWTSDTGSNKKTIVVSGIDERSSTGFRFFGEGAAGTYGLARIWGISEDLQGSSENYFAEYVCSLALTLGGTNALDTTTGSIFSTSGMRFATVIDVDADESLLPGIRVSGRNGGAPKVIIDSEGHIGYIVEMTRQVPAGVTGTAATKLGFMLRVF